MTAKSLFRWTALALAVFYFVDQFRAADQTVFAAQFRFLTIWALCLYLVAHAWVIAHARGWLGPCDVLISVAAPAAALVVLLYWRLYFTDPALVNGGEPIPWYREGYLHIMGPVLIWIEALFLSRSFRRIWPGILGLVTLNIAYVGWIEWVVQPNATQPSGSVTNGLPYPFLNSMEWGERLGFYSTSLVSLMAFFAVGVFVTWVVRRMAD